MSAEDAAAFRKKRQMQKNEQFPKLGAKMDKINAKKNGRVSSPNSPKKTGRKQSVGKKENGSPNSNKGSYNSNANSESEFSGSEDGSSSSGEEME